MNLKKCIYCGKEKPVTDFSDEHIWPDALGGDFLDPFWRTQDVCEHCNNLSGVYVDGAFIKGFFGSAERATGARDYVDVSNPNSVCLPLDYFGPLNGLKLPPDEIGEYWAGPCGANILHIRPADSDDHWSSYAGGDPRAKKLAAGRAYMALTSKNLFWVQVSLNSFKAHFKRARRFVTNLQVNPQAIGDFKNYFGIDFPDLSDPTQAHDMEVMNTVVAAGKNGTSLESSLSIQLDTGTRMLAKLALAVGYKLFGADFLDTAYATDLRSALWERDANKRQKLPIKGTGYLGTLSLGDLKNLLAWPGGWLLSVKIVRPQVILIVVTPIGKTMSVVISDSIVLVDSLDQKFKEGLIWLIIPSLSRSEGPIWLPDYLAHREGSRPLAALTAIEALRIDPSSLPSCW